MASNNLFLNIINNGSPEPLRDCALWLMHLKRWSVSTKQFVVVKELDGKSSSLLFSDHLYADQPFPIDFIQTTDSRDLIIKPKAKEQPTLILPQKEGIWRVSLHSQIGAEKFSHRICFEWILDKSLKFVQCPDADQN